jgi:hypothetical protein
MSSQFKFKPDKIKYLSTIDTLDSSHKKIVNGINKKRDDMPKKEKRLLKLKNELELLDSNNSQIHNYIIIRTKLVDEINNLTEEIENIENYEDELDYYEKTHEILFNYYDIIDGHKIVSTDINNNSINNINKTNSDSQNFNNFEISDISDIKPINNNPKSNLNNLSNTNSILKNNLENSDIKLDPNSELYSDIKIDSNKNILTNNTNQSNPFFEVKNNDWEIDGIEIFKKTNTLDKLDILNQMSKMKRKEKKTTRKRVKNVESLVRDSNNIFDYLEGKITSDVKKTNFDTDNKENNSNLPNIINVQNAINLNIINNTYNLNIDNNDIIDNLNDKKILKYDRASLFEDYKILLEGYPTQKKSNKQCMSCGPFVNKVLIYSEGIYVCLICGEVEKCIIENEITNYKDPMVEKPTFPYKRKNHFCEWINLIYVNFLYIELHKILCRIFLYDLLENKNIMS